MAISISILIVVIGLISLFSLPVEQYPDIAPPTVQVSATYTGADAEAVMNSVIMPLEESINGVEDMMYITSTATNAGTATIEVYFKQGTDPDMAAVNVQNRVSKAQGLLPAEVTKIGVTTQKRQTSFLQINALASTDGRYDKIFLGNYMDINVIPQIKRVEGVGDVMMLGDTYSMRIWLHPERMAQYGLVPSDVTAVLGEQNIEAPTGSLGENSKNVFQFTMKYRGRLKSVDEFRNTVVRAQADGSVLRLKDVADVELGTQTYSFSSEMDGKPAVMFIVFQTAGSNATAVNESISKKMKEMEKDLPQGTEFVNMMSSNDFLFASIHNVVETLVIAIILVVLVVYFFLQDFKSTLIPSISIIVSLIGTFACLMAAGFSINILTLFALVLAIGTVVDDAIVVVENVERIMHEEHLPAYEATKKAMDGLVGALIATSLVLVAVFVPVSFLSGITGMLYRQFTVTIAVSVIISTVVALTLSPVMCSLILKPSVPDHKKNIVFRKINHWLGLGNRQYVRGIRGFVGNPRRVMSAFGVSLVVILLLHRIVPTSFLPVEDQGYFKVELELPEGATLPRTRTVTDRAIAFVKRLPAVDYVQNVTGSSPRVGTSQARSELTVILKPWDERGGVTIEEVMAEVRKELETYPECKVYLSTPPVIPGLGSSGGFELQLEARGEASFQNLVDAVDTLMFYASKRKELTGLSSSLQAEIPQLYFDVDRDKVKFSGVPLADVFSTMKAYTGSLYVNDFNMFNRVYKVYLQAEAPYRANKENINLFFVRGEDGQMIPLTSFGEASFTTGPGSVKRFNMFTSSVVRGEAAKGYSTGQAMAALEEIAQKHLPQNIAVEWSGLSYQEKQAGGQTGLVMALVFVFVFLFLAALYESWLIPAAVLLSLPVAALGAYLGVWACGLENDVYFQIGLVMLMGLAAKNAILIVEFAKEQMDAGHGLIEATLHAAQLRFRPILMTSLAFILGMVPMVLATGPGSASRRAIGTGVFFGMVVAVIIGILLVPFFFVYINKAKNKLVAKWTSRRTN